MADIDSTVRTESFNCPDPADIQVHLGAGEALVELVDTVAVSVAVSPLSADAPADAVADLLRGTTVHFTRGRLVVQPPRRRPVPVRVVVQARPGSTVQLTGGDAHFTVSGRAGSLEVQSSGGGLTADQVDGKVKIRCGDGPLRLAESAGRLDARIGQGNVEIGRVAGGGARLTTGSGTVNIGTVEADLTLTTGANRIAIAEAAAGRIQVRTGPGSIRVGVRAGVTARVELSSRSGAARSDLPVSQTAGGNSALRIEAASTSGDIFVTTAS
ncbi:DUF4097 family beta strand repeat-containing protein [Micromonospora sp. WMMA1363]|uniref:DUF4097 family beta strand repeat-containing protein n=1 Tax=Micromonospora sp. WMMA1363 TaxID=3053985 RepID=UPI00259D0705|nr:DUF4097 family beta strand repeat-containing protein [Micromonospora sp. WMMA1363]MDM4718207.1 DUF4097 family beta strand repeat-containing protein [Micromonospora sp. WMMA1363]